VLVRLVLLEVVPPADARFGWPEQPPVEPARWCP
jgi:hypothetical protein